MRTREVLSSLGAGGSLIAAGLVSLLLFSSLLAYKARPGDAVQPPDGSVAMRTPAAKADGRAASGPVPAVVAAAAPLRRETGDARRSRRRRPARPAPRRAPDRAATRVFAPSAPVASGPAAAAAPESSRTAEPAPAPTSPSRPGPGGGGGSPVLPVEPGPVQTVTDTGRGVIEQITEPLPPAVKEPVGTVLDTADDVAETVDETVEQALPSLLP